MENLEFELYRLSDFLMGIHNHGNIKCAVENSEGNFHRKYKNKTNDVLSRLLDINIKVKLKKTFDDVFKLIISQKAHQVICNHHYINI